MNNSKTFIGFIAHKIVEYVTANNPEYIASHKLFTEANVQGELSEYLNKLEVFLLIPLAIYLAFKLYERIRLYVKYKDYKGTARGVYEKPNLFSKKAATVFVTIFMIPTVMMTATFVGGFKPQEFPMGMKMEYLQFQPGNQPITDEIVGFAAENIYPEIIEVGEMALDVITDPELATDIVKDMTGLDVTSATKKFEKKRIKN